MGIVTEGILNMPFELAMSDELLRRQFYDTVRAELSRLRQENEELRAQLGQAASTRQKMNDAMAGLHSQAERAEADNARLREDQERLDWLEQVNLRMNERNVSVYGWKYEINHNRAALTDCNLPALTIREAIDSARFPDKAAEIRLASSKEGARLKAFDERFPGVRERARAALEQKQ